MSSNVIGLIGVAIIVTAIGLLAGWKWGLLALGVALVVMAYALWTHERQAQVQPAKPASGVSS